MINNETFFKYRSLQEFLFAPITRLKPGVNERRTLFN